MIVVIVPHTASRVAESASEAAASTPIGAGFWYTMAAIVVGIVAINLYYYWRDRK